MKTFCHMQRCIDLSADFRLKDVKVYEEWYKMEHKAPQYIEEAVYGLCEINREKMQRRSYRCESGLLSDLQLHSPFIRW